jgi:hypothetical protein
VIFKYCKKSIFERCEFSISLPGPEIAIHSFSTTSLLFSSLYFYIFCVGYNIMETNPGQEKTHMYLRGEDSSDCLLVERSLFAAANQPIASWFSLHFGGEGKAPPAPIGHKDNIPIYFVGVALAVLAEFIQCLRFPAIREEAPKSLQSRFSLRQWRAMLDFYQITEDINPRPVKRTKLEEADGFGPNFVYIRSVCEALASHIEANHPKFPDFKAGRLDGIQCIFLNSHKSAQAPLTFFLDVPSHGQIRVAFELGIKLHSSGGRSGDGNYIKSAPASFRVGDKYAERCLERAFGGAYHVSLFAPNHRKSHARKPIPIREWPTGYPRPVYIQKYEHDMLTIKISRMCENVDFSLVSASDDDVEDGSNEEESE